MNTIQRLVVGLGLSVMAGVAAYQPHVYVYPPHVHSYEGTMPARYWAWAHPAGPDYRVDLPRLTAELAAVGLATAGLAALAGGLTVPAQE